MFQLNSWIPLVGNSSKLVVRNDSGHQHSIGKDQESADATEVASTDTKDLISAAQLGLSHPTLGANASPEVTHRFCRLPLVTFHH